MAPAPSWAMGRTVLATWPSPVTPFDTGSQMLLATSPKDQAGAAAAVAAGAPSAAPAAMSDAEKPRAASPPPRDQLPSQSPSPLNHSSAIAYHPPVTVV